MSKSISSKTESIQRCRVCGLVSDPEYCSDACLNYKQRPGQIKPLFDLVWGVKTVLASKALLKLALLPLLITLILLSLTLYLGFDLFQNHLNQWIDQILTHSVWAHSLKVFLALFSWFAAVLLLGVLFLPVSALIAMPFMDPLSAQIEATLLKASPGIALNIPYLLKELIWLSVLKIGILIPALLALFIPIIGPLLFAFLLSLTVSMDFLDLIWMRKHYSFQEKKRFLRGNLAGWFFYNLPLVLMIWVPIMQILIIPGAAAGAVRFYLSAKKRFD